MKERITLQKLMEEGWIPILTATLSAGVIVSLAHSTGMAYVTALLLMTLYFVAIAANRVNAKVVALDIGRRLLQQAIQRIGETRCVEVLRQFKEQALLLLSAKYGLARRRIHESIKTMTAHFAKLVKRMESILSSPVE